MKKLIIASLCIFALASCDVKQSKEYKGLKAQQDSLLQANTEAQSELSEMMEIINGIEENFDQIKEAEKYLTLESKADGQLSTDKKTKIRNDLTMINEIMEKNKAEIEKLNKLVKTSSGEAANLKRTVDRLNKELSDRAKTIVQLQEALQKRDSQIKELESSLLAMQGDVDMLSTQATEQATLLAEKDSQINTAYYMFGTSRELKEAKVISGGFLRSSKILTDGIEKSKFIQVDIREKHEISVFAKKAKLLSDHPDDSYAFSKDENENIVINILDYNRFWSLTKFLIIEVS